MVRLDPAFLALLCLLDLSVSWDQRPGGLPEWVTPVYAVLGYLPLLWRRRFPLPVLLIVVAHALLAWVVAYGYVPTFNVWLGLYAVAFHCGRRAAVIGLLAASTQAALNVVDEVRRSEPAVRSEALVVSAVLGTVIVLTIFGVGRWAAWTVRQQRLVAELAAAEAITAERGRITRDLHDIVAHAVSLMVLQAAGAAKILRKDPDRAQEALHHVDVLGQQAIGELRRMLGILTDGTEKAVTDPLPGLRDLDVLVEHMRTAGLPVELDVTGTPTALAPGAELSAYRIVQEALTNASRYADRRLPVQVHVRWQPAQLEVRVRNQCPVVRRHSAHPLSTGRGLLGMQERAAAAGGRLQVGPQPDGGFLVTAVFPLTRPPEPAAPDGHRTPPSATEPPS
ncbi:sensor histidine kinase [Streptomyces poonensis]|nr:histidine kinase [Streptomyces poonensis]